MQSAVIDRLEDGMAVLLVGSNEDELIIPQSDLPPECQKDGLWLHIEITKGQLISATPDLEKTQTTQNRIREKMNALRKKGRKTRDD